MSETAMTYEQACRETERLSEHLDITNADHIALWLETNMDDSSIAWLAVQMVDAHERAAKHLAMDALIADSADMYDAPAMGEVVVPCDGVETETAAWDWLETKFGTEADDPVDRAYAADEMVDAFHAGAGWRFKATAALSAMSPAGEVERIVAWLRRRGGQLLRTESSADQIAGAELLMKAGEIERGDYRND